MMCSVIRLRSHSNGDKLVSSDELSIMVIEAGGENGGVNRWLGSFNISGAIAQPSTAMGVNFGDSSSFSLIAHELAHQLDFRATRMSPRWNRGKRRNATIPSH